MQYISAPVAVALLIVVAWVVVAPLFNDGACDSIRQSSLAFRGLTWFVFRCP